MTINAPQPLPVDESDEIRYSWLYQEAPLYPPPKPVKINLPCFVRVENSFDEFIMYVRIFLPELKVFEVNDAFYKKNNELDGLGHLGLFYIGKRPSKSELQELFEQKEIIEEWDL